MVGSERRGLGGSVGTYKKLYESIKARHNMLWVFFFLWKEKSYIKLRQGIRVRHDLKFIRLYNNNIFFFIHECMLVWSNHVNFYFMLLSSISDWKKKKNRHKFELPCANEFFVVFSLFDNKALLGYKWNIFLQKKSHSILKKHYNIFLLFSLFFCKTTNFILFFTLFLPIIFSREKIKECINVFDRSLLVILKGYFFTKFPNFFFKITFSLIFLFIF